MADRDSRRSPSAIAPELKEYLLSELEKDRRENGRRFDEIDHALATLTRLIAPQVLSNMSPGRDRQPEPARAAGEFAEPVRTQNGEFAANSQNSLRTVVQEPAKVSDFNKGGCPQQLQDWVESSPFSNQAFESTTSKKQKSGPAALFRIRQKDNETLAHYIGRFNREILDIADAQQSEHQMALMHGLVEGPFKFEVTRNPPRSFGHLVEIANQFTEGEAMNPNFISSQNRVTRQHQGNSYRRNSSSSQSFPQGKHFRSLSPPGSFSAQPQQRSASSAHLEVYPNQTYDPTAPRHKDYMEKHAILGLPMEKILPIIRDMPEYVRPHPMSLEARNRHKDLFCRHHWDTGHDTQNCRDLRKIVKKLSKAGKLQDCAPRQSGYDPSSSKGVSTDEKYVPQ